MESQAFFFVAHLLLALLQVFVWEDSQIGSFLFPGRSQSIDEHDGWQRAQFLSISPQSSVAKHEKNPIVRGEVIRNDGMSRNDATKSHCGTTFLLIYKLYKALFLEH